VWHTHETIGEHGKLCVSIALAVKVQGENYIQDVEDDTGAVHTRPNPHPDPVSHHCVRHRAQEAASRSIPVSFLDSLDLGLMRSLPLPHIHNAASLTDDDLIHAVWLSFVSSSGCAHAPFPMRQASQLVPTQSLPITILDTIVYSQAGEGGRVLLAANGCVFPTELTVGECKLLQRELWPGRTLPVMHPIYVLEMSNDIATAPGGGKGGEKRVLLALQNLMEARAIVEGALAERHGLRPRGANSRAGT